MGDRKGQALARESQVDGDFRTQTVIELKDPPLKTKRKERRGKALQ